MSASLPPPDRKPSLSLTVRLSAKMVERIDKAGMGGSLSRAETIRQVLRIGLDQVEGPR